MTYTVKSVKVQQLLLDEASRDDDHIDTECIPLCDVLNLLDGIDTISSCCGHGYAPFRIYFAAKSLESVRPILAVIDESEVWTLRVSMATGNMEIYFALDGTTGETAYAAANQLGVALDRAMEATNEHRTGSNHRRFHGSPGA
jgi:hypothetical protein